MIGSLLLTFALYVIITGIYDLVLRIYNKIKSCFNKREKVYSVASSEQPGSLHSIRSGYGISTGNPYRLDTETNERPKKH